MRKIQVAIDRGSCRRRAEVYFRDAAGIYGGGLELGEMKRQADEVIGLCDDRFRPGIACAYTEDFLLHGRRLTAGGADLVCPAFELIDPGAVKGVYAYVLTAGDFAFPEMEMTGQVFADIWGTSLTEAVKDEISEQLAQDGPLSDHFGPGLYGMDLERIFDMPKLVPFGDADVTLTGSGVMQPVKSYAGIVFRVTDAYEKMGAACAECAGNVMSCRLCRMRRIR